MKKVGVAARVMGRRPVAGSLALLLAGLAPAVGHAGPGGAAVRVRDDDGSAPPARIYGLDDEQPLETLPPPGPAPSEQQGAPNTHTVKRGDTLWDIARRYFRDPYHWPKIWALNPEVSNPHWIFPGQSLRLRDGRSAAVVAVAAEAAPTPARAPAATSEPSSVALAPAPPSAAAMADAPELRQLGFVDEGDLKAAGTINGSLEEKILLGTGDHAYVEFPADKQPKGGARFTVYQVDTEHPIREPLSSTVLGYLVHIYGDVVIDSLTDRPIANGRLVDLVAPVERGYRVGPHVRRLRAVRPKHNEADMTARIVASVEPNMLIANAMFVVLNRGSRHGVEPGNRFLVLRQGDGIKRVMEDWEGNDHRFPPHAVAEIVAVDVQNETTIGWISRGTRELHTGEVADLRRGY